ncbi:hypothetical protein GCM10007242_07600 [Pigmentiphaga litoralis]|uniref:hypothetical protein n=1 Tax=Pigmentiphaga litoralis TaxID=516702 RepID=UPI001671E1F5|nr:hypothetical protein [Pigmentiphaga litoralis]GGX04845.1 hypothetical protein GCM10007242_07600 [Pigmentiphaga litoralis]
MRIVMVVAGVVLMALGLIWFLQGINVLPGSFMTGQMQWAIYGVIAFVIGLFLFVRGRRRIS